MKDALQKELKVGQTVVFTEAKTISLYTGVIIKFTKAMVTIQRSSVYKGTINKYPGGLIILH